MAPLLFLVNPMVIFYGIEIRLVPANKSNLRRALAWLRLVSLDDFYMTYRLPFQRYVRITHPGAPRLQIINHEMIHARDFAKWWGPWIMPLLSFLPLPVFFSGRWFIERRAYLHDIRRGRYTVEQAADTLWESYAKPWPRKWMLAWFERELAK